MNKCNCKNCKYLGNSALRPFIKDPHWCRLYKGRIILNIEDSDCKDFEEAKDNGNV
ncbi:MAG: hypothetical protein IIT65_11555 [Lachnospiraceae bacterium]|nr:hypothetical protein [Lachnospiraceae bacterium]